MSSKQNLEYVYNYPAFTFEGALLAQYEFQLVVEDVLNQVVRYHNVENQEVAAWFLAQNVNIVNIIVIVVIVVNVQQKIVTA